MNRAVYFSLKNTINEIIIFKSLANETSASWRQSRHTYVHLVQIRILDITYKTNIKRL